MQPEEDLNISLSEYEFLIFAIYNIVAIAFLFVYKAFDDKKSNRYIFPAYIIKILGGFIFSLIYIYYYKGGGDTYYYYVIISDFTNIFYENPTVFFDGIFSDLEHAKHVYEKAGYSMVLVRDDETFFFTRFQIFFNILSFDSYLGLTLINSLISFLTAYKLMNYLNTIIRNNEFQIFAIVFLVPSVIIWGGGIMKDTITLSSFNLSVIYLHKIVIKRDFKKIFYILIPLFLIFKMKAYILICFLSWIVFFVFFYLTKKSKNPISKFLFIPYLMIIIAVAITFSSTYLLNSSAEYKVDDIYDRIRGFHDYHVFLKGSAYDLGEIDYSIGGLLSKFPQAVNVSFFRPYLWESTGNFLFLFNGIEATFISFFFLLTLFKIKTINVFKCFAKNSFVLGAIIFCIIYAFVVGVTSYNFGALSRFKIPMVPIFLFCLLYVRAYYNNKDLVEQDV